VQYQVFGSAGAATWVQYDAPVVHGDTALHGLLPNRSYRLRLVALNAAGWSAPGTPSDPIYVCHASEMQAASNFSHGAASWHAAGAIIFAVALALALVLSKQRFLSSPFRALGARHRTKGGRYQRAATDAIDTEEYEAVVDEWAKQRAYDRASATLGIDIMVPSARRPVQIEVSTVGIGSTAKLLQQLLIVTSEVTGRHSLPPAPEELHVIFEDASGVQQVLTSAQSLDYVLAATRIIVRLNSVSQ
jgi:hypothetical protein